MVDNGDESFNDLSGRVTDLDDSVASSVDELSGRIDDLDDSVSTSVDDLTAALAQLQASVPKKPGRLDQAMKEAYCSRINCCNEQVLWTDIDTMLCWSDQYEVRTSFACAGIQQTVNFVYIAFITEIQRRSLVRGFLFSYVVESLTQCDVFV